MLDDDASIHQVWQGRLAPLTALHFSAPVELRDWVNADAERARSATYLMDYELFGHEETGLDLIGELKLGDRAILVTSRFEEMPILTECLRLKTRMIPKGLAGFVPIRILQAAALDAVLIDDDSLARMTWGVAANRAGKILRAYADGAAFFAELAGIPMDTPIYIDSNLADGIRGEDVAEKLHRMGYTNIRLETGHEPSYFPPMAHIREVVGKNPPWL
ncbi:MAG: hypothetical protein Q7R41_07670 [Phycisphaerales bacterium]|nr:hypothetical protein [Phycisphaerales bacterium]